MRLKRDWWIIALLTLAALHCTQSIFFDNYSLLVLEKYENGQESMPFQGRIAMVPLLRAAHNSPALTRYAKQLEEQPRYKNLHVEAYTPEKLVSYWVGAAAMLAMVALCAWFGVRYAPDLWWLCPALLIVIFYASYGARSEQNLWYPYDLPHAALFTAAALAILEGYWYLAFAIFVVDTPFRETSLFLLPLLLAVGYVRHRLPLAAILSTGMLVFWIALRILVGRYYAHNATDVAVHYHHASQALRLPRHWPQLASAFGFLALPLFLNKHRLPRVQQALLWGALPGIAVSGVLGIWFETRLWSEWNALVACLVCSALYAWLEQRPILQRTGGAAATSPARPAPVPSA